MVPSTKKLISILILLLLILIAGILGYHLIEGWSFFDSLYMTVITLATVGYSEIHPLSRGGRLFTILMIMGGMGIILYGISEFTKFLIEGEMTGYLRSRKMKATIAKLSDHYVLCGSGAKGQHVLEELVRTRRMCVVIDNDPEKVRHLIERGITTVEGDATEDETLLAAGTERARGLIAALPADKDNLYVVITARGVNPHLRIVTKVNELSARAKFLRSGADSVVSANFIGGLRMVSEMIRPTTVQFLDTMLRDDSTLRVEDVLIPPTSKHQGQSIAAIDALKKSGALVLSIKRDHDFQFNPSPDTILQPNDSLILMGNPEQIQMVRSAFRA